MRERPAPTLTRSQGTTGAIPSSGIRVLSSTIEA